MFLIIWPGCSHTLRADEAKALKAVSCVKPIKRFSEPCSGLSLNQLDPDYSKRGDNKWNISEFTSNFCHRLK